MALAGLMSDSHLGLIATILIGLPTVAAGDGRADARVGREPGQVREEAAINGPGSVPSSPGRLPRRLSFHP